MRTSDLQRDERAIFAAKITAQAIDEDTGRYRYSWIEQVDYPVVGYQDADPAREGGPEIHTAYEINNANVAVGTYCWMRLRSAVDINGTCFEFNHCCNDGAPTEVDELTEDTPALALPPGGPSYSLTSDGPWTIGSITLPIAPTDGQEITLVNNGTWPLTLLHNDPAGDLGFRLDLPGGLDVALIPGADAVFRFDLNANGGDGGWKLVALAPPPGGGGAAPPALAAAPDCAHGSTSIGLAWAASAGPPPSTAYYVYRSTDSGMADAQLVAVTSNRYVTIPGQTTGTTYYYTVAALGSTGGISAMSPVETCVPTADYVLAYGEAALGGPFVAAGVAAGPVTVVGAAALGGPFVAAGVATQAEAPPCDTGNAYECIVAGVSGSAQLLEANGTYSLVWTSAQFWTASIPATGGTWDLIMNLGVSPCTLSFSFNDGDIPVEYALYECADFDCNSGGEFDEDTTTGTWPDTLTVTLD